MEILSFDVSGKFAHFRKFHANNTALSYSIPPRTTIIGMIAAVMGKEKNSYYTEFSDEHLKTGIRVLSNLRKSFHRLNFLRIKSETGFSFNKKGELENNSRYFSGWYSRGNVPTSEQTGPVQTPFEIVTGDNYHDRHVTYRVYVGSDISNNTFETLTEILEKDKEAQEAKRYNVSLGPANFIGFIKNYKKYEKVEQTELQDKWIEVHSACNSEQVSEINIPDDPEFKFNFIEEELLPADFVDDYNREVKRMNRVLFSTRNFPIHVKLTGTIFQLQDGSEFENIQFLDYAGMVAQ